MTTLVQLSENDKRVIIAIVLVVIILFVVVALLGSLIIKVMKWQGKRIDTLCHDVTITRVVSDKKHFLEYGRKKNWRTFFKQGWIPIVILLADVIFIIVYESCVGWNYNPFSLENGFGSWFFTWRISETEYVDLWLIAFKKLEVVHTPEFVPSAWPGYIFCPILLGAGLWYIITIQCLLSRTIRLRKLSNDIFSKSLDGFNQNKAINDQLNNGKNTDNKFGSF